MRSRSRRRFAIAVLLGGLLTVPACGSKSDPAADTQGAKAPGKAAAAKDGCPSAELLKPVLNADGGTSFSFAGSGPHDDDGWFCKYKPAAPNPMGYRLDVYSTKLKSPGAIAAASGPLAFPEFGPEAGLSTDCEADGGADRLDAKFARKGEQNNSQEIVFMAAGALIDDCARQITVMRSLAKVFYDNAIGED